MGKNNLIGEHHDGGNHRGDNHRSDDVRRGAGSERKDAGGDGRTAGRADTRSSRAQQLCPPYASSGRTDQGDQSSDNSWPVTRAFTLSADKKTLEFDAWLVYAPEITIPLHEGDSTKPTAADCILPPGLTVESLTWNADGTINELRVKEPSYPFGDTICRFSFGNGWATINGQRYQGEYLRQ